MDRETAVQLVVEIQRVCEDMDRSVGILAGTIAEPQSAAYRRIVGRMIGYMFTDFLRPIARTYPDLEPPQLRTPPQVETPLSAADIDAIGKIILATESVKRVASGADVPEGERRLWEEGLVSITSGLDELRQFIARRGLSDQPDDRARA